jgi:hypothetical protein
MVVTMGTVAEKWKEKILNTPQEVLVAGLSVGLKLPTA